MDKTNVELIMNGASILLMDGILEMCTKYMESQLDASNCLGIRSFAAFRGCVKLKEVAHDYVMVSHNIITFLLNV